MGEVEGEMKVKVAWQHLNWSAEKMSFSASKSHQIVQNTCTNPSELS